MARPGASLHVSALRLRLYVAGDGVRSRRAIESLNALCEGYGDVAQGEVVDVMRDPEAAERARVLMTPTLDVEFPGPRRRVIGDLSDLSRVVEALGLPAAPVPFTPAAPDRP